MFIVRERWCVLSPGGCDDIITSVCAVLLKMPDMMINITYSKGSQEMTTNDLANIYQGRMSISAHPSIATVRCT